MPIRLGRCEQHGVYGIAIEAIDCSWKPKLVTVDKRTAGTTLERVETSCATVWRSMRLESGVDV
jgi:hypothetical protein